MVLFRFAFLNARFLFRISRFICAFIQSSSVGLIVTILFVMEALAAVIIESVNLSAH